MGGAELNRINWSQWGAKYHRSWRGWLLSGISSSILFFAFGLFDCVWRYHLWHNSVEICLLQKPAFLINCTKKNIISCWYVSQKYHIILIGVRRFQICYVFFMKMIEVAEKRTFCNFFHNLRLKNLIVNYKINRTLFFFIL